MIQTNMTHTSMTYTNVIYTDVTCNNIYDEMYTNKPQRINSKCVRVCTEVCSEFIMCTCVDLYVGACKYANVYICVQ